MKRKSKYVNTEEKIDIIQKKVNSEKISLKTKLVLSHVFIALIPILFIVLILTTVATNSLLKNLENSNLAYVSKVTDILDGRIREIENISDIIISDKILNSTITKKSEDYKNTYELISDREINVSNKLSSLQLSDNSIANIYIIQEDEIIGNFSGDNEKIIKEFYQTNLYQTISDAKQRVVWSSMLFGTSDLYMMRSLVNIDTGKSMGTLVIQVTKTLFQEELTNDFSDKAILAVLDINGNILATPKEQKDLTDILFFNQLKSFMKNNESNTHGVLTIENGIGEKTSVLYSICSNGWIYTLQRPLSEILGDIFKIKQISYVVTISSVFFAIFIGALIAFSISKPIDNIRKIMKSVENGDLTVQSKYVGRYEIGQLSQSFNNMIFNMQSLIKEIDSLKDQVTINSMNLNNIAMTSANTSKEVLAAVDSISNGATEQAKDTESTSEIVRLLIRKISETEMHFNGVGEAMGRTRTLSNEAKNIIKILNLTTVNTIENSQLIQEDIKNLVKQFNKISGIMNLIDEISDQTNLLAINAAIEAARAGEAGKGFAVVAEEVRKLAIQSSGAVKSISKIINGIYDATTSTAEIIENGEQIFSKQEEAVANTESIVNEILLNMLDIETEVGMIYKLLEGIGDIQGQASDAIMSIAAIAEESAAAIEQVLASGQEQLSTSDQLVNMSIELNEIISEMSNQIEQFKID